MDYYNHEKHKNVYRVYGLASFPGLLLACMGKIHYPVTGFPVG
ncbi:hypothetical protein [Parabacteroides pacaensis]|nr:hypothetical protein [Parabacteroides pacaensis]